MIRVYSFQRVDEPFELKAKFTYINSQVRLILSKLFENGIKRSLILIYLYIITIYADHRLSNCSFIIVAFVACSKRVDLAIRMKS